MAVETVNDWFKSPQTPITDLAHILMELDDKGHVPKIMRDAIHKHAENSLSDIPLSIGGMSMAIAAAHAGDSGISDGDAANASWGIAALADHLHAMKEVAFQFGDKNTLRGTA